MASPIDKYAHDDKGDKSQAWEDLPPKVAPPMLGTDAVLQLYAPKDETMLDLGAGKRSGIRMVTNKHVHLTARDPLTTISLGEPGGIGINDAFGAGDGASGLQVYSEGKKIEQIDGAVREIYGDQKVETVKGAVWENYQDTKKEIVIKDLENEYHGNKTETVAGTVTETYAAEHHLNVGSLAIHSFNGGKIEFVDGDWQIHVTGQRSETIDGDKKYLYHGKRSTLAYGTVGDVFLGMKEAVNVGLLISSSMIGKYERNLGVSVSVTQGLRATRDAFKVDHCNVRKQQIDLNLDEKGIEVTKNQTKIINAAMTIIK